MNRLKSWGFWVRFSIGLCVLNVTHTSSIYAATAQIEVGSGTLPATATPGVGNPSVFTTINFSAQFAVAPNVFVMTEENAANLDPCTIRIRNITTTSFDATCLEPINEDRATGGMIFEYIAIQNGTTTVPLVGGGGNVNFVSNCNNLTNQQYGPQCNNCTGGTTYVTQPLSPPFTAAPALLTQIQSTNNMASSDPIFIDTAVRQGSVTNSQFDWAIDQMEAGTGLISNAERVCYLAVERNGCQNLNFSGIGGPASVRFQAQTGGNNIDGHGNGCSTGEGVSFAGGACFSSTPIAVAKQITRNGNNGGFIRRCSVNGSEIVLTFDEDRVSDGERNHIDETASVLAFGSAFTTPVTFSKALVTLENRNAKFEWQTSAETFHLGFDLWGEIDTQWVQLNRRFINGDGQDSTNVNKYVERVRLSRDQAKRVTRFAVSSLDSQGHEEFFGPFEPDVEYGASSAMEQIDWAQVSAAHNQKMLGNGYQKTATKGWRKVRSRNAPTSRQDVLNVDVQENQGIHVIGGEQIIALAPQFRGMPLRRLALTLNGKAVARYIESDDGRLSNSDRVYFSVKTPNGNDAIYTDKYTYQLSADRRHALKVNQFDARPDDNTPTSSTGAIDLKLTSDKKYSAANSGETPWFDQSILATSAAKSVEYTFDFLPEIDISQASYIDVQFSGGIDFPDESNDHHVQVLVNDTLLYDASFNGFVVNGARVYVPANTLQAADNRLAVKLPADTGFVADLVLIDDLTVTAKAPLEQFTVLDFSSDIEPQNYRWDTDQENLLAFAYTREGGLSVLQNIVRNNQGIHFSSPASHDAHNLRLTLGNPSEIAKSTQLSALENSKIQLTDADYLIVAHPDFIGEKLTQFVTLKQAQGFKVTVYDWLEIVAEYGFGNSTPQALARFVQAANQHSAISHMLIVGGHSYDYRGLTETGTVNFIPSHYRPIDVLRFSPTDNPYADLNNDQLPDIAIGRWPVRSNADLEAIVDKTVIWHARRSDSVYQNALLIAQAPDNRGLDFAEQLRGRVQFPMQGLPNYEQVSFLDLTPLTQSKAERPISEVQEEIRTAINSDIDVLSFSGHASNASWGFQGLVNTDFIDSLENHDNPLVIMPLACYTTNFEALTVNTLAHQWLFAGTQGAVAIHGASVLGNHRENAIFAERLLQQSADSSTYGEAIKRAKKLMSPANTMLHNWVLLGDPGLPLR